jgi:hypothetical protein
MGEKIPTGEGKEEEVKAGRSGRPTLQQQLALKPD